MRDGFPNDKDNTDNDDGDINDDTIGSSCRRDVSDIWPQIVEAVSQRPALAARLKNTWIFGQPTYPAREATKSS